MLKLDCGCRAAEKLAEMLGTPAELPSRAASAMLHVLSMAAAANGHTYLSWDQLHRDTLKLMSGTRLTHLMCSGT